MKRINTFLISLFLVFNLFAVAGISAAAFEIDTKEVSGTTGPSLTNYPMRCDSTTVGTCTITSSRKTSNSPYMEGYAKAVPTTRTVGSYNFLESYARVAYGKTKADITLSSTTQTIVSRKQYTQNAITSYRHSGNSGEGWIYCFTRISYQNSSNMQKHAGVGRYYNYIW